LLGGPVIYRYPAVMLPEFQRAVLDAVAPTGVAPLRTLDQFVGSGTTMCEATLRGFPFVGVDVNPLAILISRVKAGPFHLEAFASAAERVARTARKSRSQVAVDFPSRDKWYRPEVQVDLSRLRRAIEAEGHAPTRRFLWVVLAETARLCSNSRLTTFKLHIRPTDQLDRGLDPVGIFERVARANLAGFEQWRDDLAAKGMLRRGGWLKAEVELLHGDIRQPEVLGTDGRRRFDLVLTSPPYGDNRSTIPYGEASYLSTQWVHSDDLAIDEPLENAFAIDANSLGGSWRGVKECIAPLSERSATFRRVASGLSRQPSDRLKRVASFVRDLDQAVERVNPHLSSGAWQIWTVGSRTVGGALVPLGAMLIELQAAHDVEHVATLTRRLPTRRRAAARNDRAPRMADEEVLVFRCAQASDAGKASRRRKSL
jgi:16S rRNA G966 N2-methylase RsmD